MRQMYQALIKKLSIIIFFWKEEKIVPIPTPRKKRQQRSKDNFGCMYYLGDLLDRISSYFNIIKFLKRYDIESYNLYKKIGAQIINSGGLLERHSIHPRLKEIRPSFYMMHIGDDDYDDNSKKIHPRLIYFRKMKWKLDVQNTHGDMYHVCLFYSDKKQGYGVIEYHIAVDKDANLKLLREKKRRSISLSNSHSSRIPVITWAYPSYLSELSNNKDDTPEDIALNLFKMLMNSFFNCGDGFQINITDNCQNVATFNIDMLRTPYFFDDRKKTINHNGRTKKIFHIVRTHKRKLLNKEVFIKTHFRGLQKFLWNGYQVIIQNPKKELDLRTFTPAAMEVRKTLSWPKELIDSKNIGISIHNARQEAA